MTDRDAVTDEDPGFFIDADEDRWAWRATIRRHRVWGLIYRVAVLIFGAVVTVVGLVLVPLPGPGWLIVFAGIAILASEFEPAQRLLLFGRRTLRRWNDYMMAAPWPVKIGVTLLTLLAVAAFFWVLFKVSGVPTWLPDVAEGVIKAVPGLD